MINAISGGQHDPIKRAVGTEEGDMKKTIKIDFEDLVQFFSENSDIVMINAYIESIRRSKNIPEGVKDLLCGSESRGSGLISRHFALIKQLPGNLELAYRRGGD